MAKVDLPAIREGVTLEEKMQNVENAYAMLRRRLSYLLGDGVLDSENVIEAAAVRADWIYGNTIIADQINGGTITGVTINGVHINGSTIYGGNITVQQDINVNPVNAGGINFGYASVKFVPQYTSIEISALGGVNITPFLSYNSQEVATQSWVTANFVHK